MTINPNERYLTFNIIPNLALGFGVILVVVQHWADGDSVVVGEIPCHNTASANYTIREIEKANAS